jgi:plastocyanin
MRPRIRLLLLLVLAVGAIALVATRLRADNPHNHHTVVGVPGEDRFVPFAIQIHTGDTVDWVNSDTDDHTVVSNDAINTANPQNINVVVPGTDHNNGNPGIFSITFHQAGMWNYYCRFHSTPNMENHQPFAPGPNGGIQTDKDPTLCDPAGTDTCDFGTPMMGVVVILPKHEDDTQSLERR